MNQCNIQNITFIQRGRLICLGLLRKNITYLFKFTYKHIGDILISFLCLNKSHNRNVYMIMKSYLIKLQNFFCKTFLKTSKTTCKTSKTKLKNVFGNAKNKTN